MILQPVLHPVLLALLCAAPMVLVVRGLVRGRAAGWARCRGWCASSPGATAPTSLTSALC